MTEPRFERVGEDAAAKTTGDDELETEAKRVRNEAKGVEPDQTEAYAFPPETAEK